jgi:hypothetical protein
MRPFWAILLLHCGLGSGCVSFPSLSSRDEQLAYEDLLSGIEETPDKFPQRRVELEAAYVNKPVDDVRKDLERQRFDWQLYRPATAVVHDLVTRTPSKGIAMCSIAPVVDRDEDIVVKYDDGIVTKIAVRWSDDGSRYRETMKLINAQMRAKLASTDSQPRERKPARPFDFIENFSPERFMGQIMVQETQLEACRSIRPGMAIAKIELDLRDFGFTCRHTVDAQGNPFLEARASEQSFYLIARVYYKDGLVIRREGKGKRFVESRSVDSEKPDETWDIDLDNPTEQILIPALVRESR